MPLIEAAFRRAEDAARTEWHATGGDFTATLAKGIAAYLADPAVVEATAFRLPGSSLADNKDEATAILQAIGAKAAP